MEFHQKNKPDWARTLHSLNIEINFGTLYVGLNGTKNIGQKIDVDDICRYLDQCLYDPKYSFADEAVKLLLEKQDGLCFLETLRGFAAAHNMNLKREETKWIIVELLTLLGNLPSNEIESLLLFNDFWIENKTDECPHVFQGVGNELSPNEYYSFPMYLKLLERYLTWINTNVSILQLCR